MLRVLRVGTLTSNIVVLRVQRAGSDCTQSTESKECIFVELRIGLLDFKDEEGAKRRMQLLFYQYYEYKELDLYSFYFEYNEEEKATLTTKDALDVVLGEQRETN